MPNIKGYTPSQHLFIKEWRRTKPALLAASVLALDANSGKAAWDVGHAAFVEDMLGSYIKTLPRGEAVNLPRMFIYEGTAFSRACPNSGIDSPAYCPGDNTIYLETRLGDQVANLYGDFGALSVIAHEFGHAYLHQIGQHPSGKEGELAADSFAGGFARYAEQKGLLESGDLDEARATFEHVGDHEIYHNDHHGTPMERRQAFEAGHTYGFRLPETSSDQRQPKSEETEPRQDVPTQQLPQNPQPGSSQTTGEPMVANGGASIIGLMGGLLILALMIGIAVSMIKRSEDSDI